MREINRLVREETGMVGRRVSMVYWLELGEAFYRCAMIVGVDQGWVH